MDASLNLVPVNRTAGFQPLSGKNAEQVASPFKQNAQAEFHRVDRAGRKFTLEQQKQRLKDAAEDFEAIFARQMMKHMRSGFIGDGMFGPGAAGEIYSDMMDTAVADKIAEQGALGLADMLYSQMVKQLEPQELPVTTENRIKYLSIP